MAAGVTPDSLSLERIKSGLDPAYSYMIFERQTEASSEAAFREVFEALIRMDFGFYERQVLRDRDQGRLLLIIKFAPGRSDKIMQAFLSIGLPKDISFYAYGSQSAT